MSNRLGGKQGTAYLGTNANQPPNLTYNDRPPTAYDINYSIGDFWIDSSAVDNEKLWVLVSLQGDANSKGFLGHWIQIGPGTVGNLETLTGDSGGAITPDGTNNINIVGGAHITVTGDLPSHTLTIDSDGEFADEFTADVGTASPAMGNLNVFGGSNMNTSAAADTVTINLNDNITWPATGPGTGYIDIDGSVFLHAYGLFNSFIGADAGNFSMTSINSTGIGAGALQALTSGDDNSALGFDAGTGITTGTRNTLLGTLAGSSLTTGSDNVYIGFNAGEAMTTNSSSVLIGSNVAENNAGANGIVAIGHQAFQTLAGGAAFTTCVGYQSLQSQNSAGLTNDAFGAFTGTSITSGGANSLFARSAGSNLTTGSHNLLLGRSSGSNYTTESNNIIVGENSGVVGDDNVIRIGDTGQATIAIGGDALALTSHRNIAIGYQALTSSNGIIDGDNVALGYQALNNLAGNSLQNVAVGFRAGTAYTTTESNNIVINDDGVIGDSNTIRIGNNANTSAYIQGIYGTTGLTSPRNVVVQSDGQLGTNAGGGDVLTCAFSYYNTIQRNNVTGNSLTFYTVPFNTQIYDINGDFDGVSTFTAPFTGYYSLFSSIHYLNVSASNTALTVFMITPTDVFVQNNVNNGAGRITEPGAVGQWDSSITATPFLTAGDTVTVEIIGYGSVTNNVAVWGSAVVGRTAGWRTLFSGYYLGNS